ncbi:MAG: hypothetical protein K0V04_08115 [Deltaproteobacteria bacterium]|nr:hypothetical protein [Deltaproteobacteria bacterium]
MADDRTIAPGSSRLQRAWAAGLRPRAGWLLPAMAVGLSAMAVDGMTRGPIFDVRPGAVSASAWLPTLGWWLAGGWLVAGALVVVVAVSIRRLGGVSSVARDRLSAAQVRPAATVRICLTVLLWVGLTMALVGVVAGAARAADAGEAGLTALWWGWTVRGGAVLAVGLGLAALVELFIDRHERVGALFQSREQVREQARARGGASR